MDEGRWAVTWDWTPSNPSSARSSSSTETSMTRTGLSSPIESQTFRKQRTLPAIRALNEASHPIPRKWRGIISRIIQAARFTQRVIKLKRTGLAPTTASIPCALRLRRQFLANGRGRITDLVYRLLKALLCYSEGMRPVSDLVVRMHVDLAAVCSIPPISPMSVRGRHRL